MEGQNQQKENFEKLYSFKTCVFTEMPQFLIFKEKASFESQCVSSFKTWCR